MSEPDGLSEALRFLRLVRQDPDLRARLRALDPEDGLDPVLALAAAAGCAVTAESLRRAHRIDWQLRRARYA